MSGLPGWDSNVGFCEGVYEEGAGTPTLRFSLNDEGFLSATTDSPPSTPFLARIVNADDFYIDQQPSVWFEGTTPDNGAVGEYAAFGQLDIDDPNGEYDYLIGSEIKGALAEFQLPIVPGSLTGAPIVATAIVDDFSRVDWRTKRLTLKDRLADYDRPLRGRRVPSFYGETVAGRWWPMTFGACRSVEGLLIDPVNRIIALHDGQITNITAVRDMGAVLDPNAAPPQYVPAMNGQAIQLETDPVGKVTVDCSSEGAQAVIAGADDVLAGAGSFTPWTGTAPMGWSWSNFAGSQILQRDWTDGYDIDPSLNIASLGSSRPWNPNANRFGDYLSTTNQPLKAGRAYRITFKVYQTFGAAPFFTNGVPAGLMLRTAISSRAEDAISPHGYPIETPMIGNRAYGFTYRVPAGANRDLYILAVSAQGNSSAAGMGLGGGLIYDVRIEELGQYIEMPLTGITLADYFYEILHDRVGDTDTWEPSDLEALDADPGYLFGVHFADQPTIVQALRAPLDSFGATVFTDAAGKIRVRRFVAPEDATIVAAFNIVSLEPNSIQKRSFKAPALTTKISGARNWSPASDGDLVSDTLNLPLSAREQLKAVGQWTRTSSKNPARGYQYARGNAELQSLIEDADQGSAEIDRLMTAFSPRIIDGARLTGECGLVDFTVVFDGTTMGAGPTIEAYNLLWGDGITLDTTLPDGSNPDGFTATPMVVMGRRYYPYGQKMTITALYSVSAT